MKTLLIATTAIALFAVPSLAQQAAPGASQQPGAAVRPQIPQSVGPAGPGPSPMPSGRDVTGPSRSADCPPGSNRPECQEAAVPHQDNQPGPGTKPGMGSQPGASDSSGSMGSAGGPANETQGGSSSVPKGPQPRSGQ